MLGRVFIGLVIVLDYDIECVAILPAEADAPLVIVTQAVTKAVPSLRSG
jgi:hypothetical protein